MTTTTKRRMTRMKARTKTRRRMTTMTTTLHQWQCRHRRRRPNPKGDTHGECQVKISDHDSHAIGHPKSTRRSMHVRLRAWAPPSLATMATTRYQTMLNQVTRVFQVKRTRSPGQYCSRETWYGLARLQDAENPIPLRNLPRPRQRKFPGIFA